ncbi:uncharacterized protein LOC134212499 isoform X2 [Armigeres subalbatus]|uniref:uncharacterized protein LOC134212499 isoform X2 n=1 Tax=Armigeres subalbatus TaxID=124917 RepID=UPI002ED5FDE3
MEASLAIVVPLIILITGAHSHSNPGSCSVTDDDLDSIKIAIQKAAKTTLDEILPEETLAKCPVLRDVTHSLQTVATEILQMKESAIHEDQVSELKQSFEQQLNEIVKSRDIFEKQSGTELTKMQGEMIDRMTALQVKVAELERQIAERTRRMYEDVAELIFERLQMNSTDSIRNYTKHMMDQKLDELLTKLEKNFKVFLGALRFLNQLNDQNLIDKVFDGILKRLEDNPLDSNENRENGKHELKDLFRVALKFYPNTADKAANVADIRSRQYCSARFPVNVITWFAVSHAV